MVGGEVVESWLVETCPCFFPNIGKDVKMDDLDYRMAKFCAVIFLTLMCIWGLATYLGSVGDAPMADSEIGVGADARVAPEIGAAVWTRLDTPEVVAWGLYRIEVDGQTFLLWTVGAQAALVEYEPAAPAEGGTDGRD